MSHDVTDAPGITAMIEGTGEDQGAGGGWGTNVYVPNAKRWGWVRDIHC